jgi:thiamine pyrophosphate-dependent acetolactate synthase large subunit-like protein
MTEVAENVRAGVAEPGSNGAELALDTLIANGVDTVFGIPGVHTLALYDALHDRPVRHILARHEQGAGFMADGYARASGKPGVALIITGPGITNVATPIGEAYTDGSPVFVVSANVEREYLDAMRGNLHDLKDQRGVMAAVTQWNERVMDPADAPAAIAEGLHRLNNGRRRPVHIELPLDVMDEPVPHSLDLPRVEITSAPAGAEAISRAVDAIAAAKRIAIYAGGGAVASANPDALLQLASRLSAPVVTSVMGKGAAPEDDPFVLGATWAPGNAVDQLWKEADLVVVVGSKLGAMQTQMFQLTYPETIVRIDIDVEEMTRNVTPSHPLLGDAAATLTALVAEIDRRDLRVSSFPEDRIAEVKRTAIANAWGADRDAYIQAVRRAVPRDGITVWDMTMMAYVGQARFPVYEPRTYLFPSGYGTLGFSLPVALGAKVACPDKAVVAVIGDGGYQFTMAELATAVQFEITVPIVIFDDSTYSAVKDAQRESRESRYIAVDLINPDFLKLAEAYGVPGVRPETPEALEAEIVAALQRTGPTIINTPIPGWA